MPPKVTVQKIIPLFIILYALFFILTSPAFATCDPTAPIDPNFGPCPAGLAEFEATVGHLVSVIVGLAFVATLVLLIMAGFKYLTSGGEPKAIAAAHQTTTWALLGILFMAIAWLILQLIESFTGIKVTIFDIKTLCGGAGLIFCKPSP